MWIKGTTQEFCVRPVVELHRFSVGVEPVRKLVLRNVDGPVRGEWHVGQVVHVHLVVQRQGVVATAPVVAHAGPPVHDERVDAALGEPRSGGKTSLPTTYYEYCGFFLFKFSLFPAPIQPIGPSEIPRIGAPARPERADLLLVALQVVQGGQKRPGARLVAIGLEAHDAVRGSVGRVETKERLDARGACPSDGARRCAIWIDAEARRPCARETG